MFYRRNADTRLRILERQLNADYNLDNLLAYNQELLRHGMLPQVAPQYIVKEALRNLLPDFYIWEIQDLQFPGLEIQVRMAGKDTSYPVLPTYKEHFDAVDAKIRTAIPLLVSLGWIALVKQCGEITLKIKRDRTWNEYIVQWVVNKEVDDDKSYHTDDKQDAEQTMEAMRQSAYPTEYPEISAVPRAMMGPSGRITRRRLIADQWRKGENVLCLTQPELRRGLYPTAIVLLDDGDGTFTTMQYRVPYDDIPPSTDHGNYRMPLMEARIDYLRRVLDLSDKCRYELFEGEI